jgi:hypothetical protein
MRRGPHIAIILNSVRFEYACCIFVKITLYRKLPEKAYLIREIVVDKYRVFMDN